MSRAIPLGFEELKARAQQYPPEQVAAWTGISADDIRKLAREYATVRPSVIRVNYGIQRSERGGMSMRAVTMLPCLTGSWKEVGGGLQMSTSGAFGLNSAALRMPELMEKALGRPARIVNMVQLGRALNSLTAPPIQALFVYNSNPAAVCPNHNEVIRGLMRTDLFTVVHEQFFTDTTDYADIVLPATTFFEHKDLQGGLRSLLSSGFKPGNRSAGRMPLQCRTCSARWLDAWDLKTTVFARPWIQ